ncbi:mitochondrial carrier [Russula vinacea]|nr:mitochondrial carrier [Russula vinacea]
MTTERKQTSPLHVPHFTPANYGSFFLAAIDVIKTRIQIDPALAHHSLVSGGRPSALLTGFGPTAVGYFVQGGGKFAGYELWKKQFVTLAGDKDTAVKYRTAIYLGAASVGEFFADILLTPLEATRIRLVSQHGYATGLVSGFMRILREGGVRDLYAGFIPILFKQIPYAIGQFTVNELCHEAAFRSMSKETRAKLSPTAKFSIMLGSGVIAGFAAAVLSQPADTLLSQINKGHGPKGSVLYRLGILARQTGFKGLFAGLGPRMVMTAGLVSGQFLIYDAINKVPMGAPQGVEIHKASKRD